MSEINVEFLLGATPAAEATLYRVLIQLIPAPSAESPNQGGRQIEMAELARLTGFTKRWVIELMNRLEKKSFIRTDGGSGAVKWIWLLPPGVLRLGRPYPTKLRQRKKTSPGKAKAPRAAASIPKRRRKETTPSLEPVADVNVAPSVEKPVEIPSRRRKEPTPSILPAKPAPDNTVVLSTTLTPPPPPAPAGLTLPATTVAPAPSTRPGDPAARNPRVRAAKIAPPPSTAPGNLAADNVVVPAAMRPPAPSGALGAPAAGNPVVIATRVPPAPSAASASPAARNPMRAAKVAPLPSMAPDSPAPGIPVVPAAVVTPAPPEPAAPTIPAKRISPRKSTKELPAGQSRWERAPIEELVAYACALSFTPEQIRDLKTPGMTKHLLLLALKRLCQQIERGRKPCPDRWSLVGALRTILSDL